MPIQSRLRKAVARLGAMAFALFAATSAFAAGQSTPMTSIDVVAVNGGTDTANPGTSCIKVLVAVAPVCTGGYVAIPNNNKELLTSALVNKATGGSVAIYYETAAGSNHCPGIVFTPCALISIFGQ